MAARGVGARETAPLTAALCPLARLTEKAGEATPDTGHPKLRPAGPPTPSGCCCCCCEYSEDRVDLTDTPASSRRRCCAARPAPCPPPAPTLEPALVKPPPRYSCRDAANEAAAAAAAVVAAVAAADLDTERERAIDEGRARPDIAASAAAAPRTAFLADAESRAPRAPANALPTTAPRGGVDTPLALPPPPLLMLPPPPPPPPHRPPLSPDAAAATAVRDLATTLAECVVTRPPIAPLCLESLALRAMLPRAAHCAAGRGEAAAE